MAAWLTTRMQKHSSFLLAVPGLIWLGIFFIAPLFIVLGLSFMTRGSGGAPQLPLTLDHYGRTINTFGVVLQRSIWIAFLTTTICLVAGYPLAYFIRSRKSASVRNFALFLIVLPFWTNFLVRTYAWRMLLGREGVLNNVLQTIGLTDGPLRLLNTEFAVLVGLVYGFLPFMVLPIYASLEKLDFRLVEAAYDLYATRLQALRRVVVPLSLPGIAAGCTLVFIPCLGAYVTPELLGGSKELMIGNLIQLQFGASRNWPLGSALAFTLLACVLLAMLVYLLRFRKLPE